jgi:DNA-binding NtrC family response regulator
VTADSPLPRRILAISSRFTQRPELTGLRDMLAKSEIALDVHGTFEDAFAAAAGPPPAEALLLDASFAAELPEARIRVAMEAALAQVRAAAPDLPLLVLIAGATSELVAATFRGGATDIFDPAKIDEKTLLRSLARAKSEARRRGERTRLVDELRHLTDDFLRNLVRAERRVLELEESLAQEAADADGEGAPRILVIDDDPLIRELLSRALAEGGLVMIGAESGEAGVEALGLAQVRKTPIDLAIVDKNLPGMDGLEAIRALRKLQGSLPVMVMTGYSSADTAIQAADMGVVGYVLKPFDDVRELVARVQELAARYAAERRQRRHLARFKQRHAQFLERYQTIAAQLDALKAG